MPSSVDPKVMTALGRTMKAELRKSMLLKRTMTPRDMRAAASRLIAERVVTLQEWKDAHSVALFRSIVAKGEVDTHPIDEAARAKGMRVAYPALVGDSIDTATMVFRWVDDPATMRSAGRGFAEPPATCEVAEVIDLIVVPGLAFDPTGYRVGYGAGLYDRTLPHYRSAKTVGIAFDFQLVMELPRNEHDLPVQAIVTDQRVLRV
jgi:5-formyltetrahydrofolate cyclo-ligase